MVKGTGVIRTYWSSKLNLETYGESDLNIMGCGISKLDIKTFEQTKIRIITSNISDFKISAFDNSYLKIQSYTNESNLKIETYNESKVKLLCDILNSNLNLKTNDDSYFLIPSHLLSKININNEIKVSGYDFGSIIERNDLLVTNGKIILYKRVTNDFITIEWLEKIKYEMLWLPNNEIIFEGVKIDGYINPKLSTLLAYKSDDRYVAIEVDVNDLYFDTFYKECIYFKKGFVLYECDENRFKIE